MAQPSKSPTPAARDVPGRFAAALSAHQRGALGEAISGYREVLAANPDHVDALGNLAVAQQALGRPEEAVETLRRAIALRPDLAELHVNLGAALKALGRLDEARDVLEHAIRLRPDFAQAHITLGNVERAAGDAQAALVAYERAVKIAPGSAAALSNQGLALKDLGRRDEAITRFRAALTANPGAAELHYNFGNTLRETGALDEAAEALARAVALDPRHKQALTNLGVTLRDLGRIDDALDAFDRAIALDADYADAHWNRALACLLAGDFERGWPAYEWRWRATGMQPRPFEQPLWDGAPLDGRTILLHAEQGLGDTIHFIRYAPMVAARGGRVIVECQAPLVRLVETCAGIQRVMARGESLPTFDVHAPLMSLPGLFGTRLDTIPAAVPYLAPPQDGKRELATAIDAASLRRKLGIVWAGNPDHNNDRNRSIAPALFADLAKRPDVALFGLQKGVEPDAIQALPGVPNLAPWLADFADTAFAVSRLDLVITVDTAMAHLAGALNRPVWLLLPFAPEWRWLLGREDSPWYPSMRIFRQARPGDWRGVMDRVSEALDAL